MTRAFSLKNENLTNLTTITKKDQLDNSAGLLL